jgi:hypothetical protein
MGERLPNFLRLDGIIGDINLQDFDAEFRKLVEIVIESKRFKTRNEAIIEARKYILAELIEMFGTWNKKGDCLPTGIQIGRGSSIFASVVLEGVD